MFLCTPSHSRCPFRRSAFGGSPRSIVGRRPPSAVKSESSQVTRGTSWQEWNQLVIDVQPNHHGVDPPTADKTCKCVLFDNEHESEGITDDSNSRI